MYRNLNILVDQGEASRLESSRGRDRFDRAGYRHAHFHCDTCGMVYDLPVENEMLISTRQAAEAAGHRVLEEQVDLIGICTECVGTD